MIGHLKQCVQSRITLGVLKIEKYAQRLTHGACMGEASSYSGAPDNSSARLTNWITLRHSRTHFVAPLDRTKFPF